MTATQWSDLPLVLTSDQAAAVLQLTRRTITNMLDRGDLHGFRVGKEWRVSRAELVRFVEGDAVESHAATILREEALPSVTDKGGVLVAQVEPLDE
jgi:excisionase family DNA binding protein